MAATVPGMGTPLYRLFINRELPLRERGCDSKVPFASRREAKAFARFTRRGDGALKPYHCRWADHWHLGHNARAAVRQRRAVGRRRLRVQELEAVASW